MHWPRKAHATTARSRAPTAAARAVVVPVAKPGTDLTENFRKLLASPTIASKKWVTGQYDSMVRTNTRVGPGAGDAAVLRLKESKRAIALATDGNGRWGCCFPEAWRDARGRRSCTQRGLHRRAPDRRDELSEFRQSRKARSDVAVHAKQLTASPKPARVLEAPITGGNVSFYNETLGNPIYPTPIIGVLGLMEDAEFSVGSAFRAAGDAIVLLDGASETNMNAEETVRSFCSSEYAKEIHGVVIGTPPAIDLAAEKRLIDCLVKLAAEKAISSAHDISDGGIAVTLAESCFASQSSLGAEVKLDASAGLSAEAAVFGERGARAVVSVAPSLLARLQAIASQCGVTTRQIGAVVAGDLRIQYGEGRVIQAPIGSLHKPWSESLQKAIENG